MMSELDYRCTHCGAVGEIEEETSDYFICASCGAKVIKNKSLEFTKRIKELAKESVAEQLQNYRKLINESLDIKNNEFLSDITKEILSILPNDFEANFYYKLSNRIHYPKDYESFLKTIYLSYTLDEVKPYLSIMINKANYNDLEYINQLLDHYELKEEYKELINKRKEKIEAETDLYANIKRDCFICHSSKDSVLLNNVVSYLEEDGYNVWYSERNMPWDPINYWDNIKEAIKNCKVFLLLITENSKHSLDVKKELGLAKELDIKNRVAIIDGITNPGIEIRQFLSDTGSEWINNSEINALDKLSMRIYELKNIKKEETKVNNIVNNNTSINNNSHINNEIENLLDRAFLFIEDSEWDKADDVLENVLNKDARCGKAYLGKLLIELKLNKKEELSALDKPFNTSNNYEKVVRFGSHELNDELKGYLEKIVKKKEEQKIQEELSKQKELEEQKIQEELRKQKELEKRKKIKKLNLRKENSLTFVDFGSFPQSRVNDSSLITYLNTLTTTNPNGYYEYEGKEYCKVTKEIVKKSLFKKETVTENKWFKVEPIKWRVLYTSNNEYTLLSEYLLIAKRFDAMYSNYQNSELRSYLVNDFYNQVFTTNEKSFIQSNTSVNNDKVWLLSEVEVCKTSYGFDRDKACYDTNRRSKPTDYALSSGAYFDTNYDTSNWWIRPSSPNYSDLVSYVCSNGNAGEYGSVYRTELTVRPALLIKINQENQ